MPLFTLKYAKMQKKMTSFSYQFRAFKNEKKLQKFLGNSFDLNCFVWYFGKAHQGELCPKAPFKLSKKTAT